MGGNKTETVKKSAAGAPAASVYGGPRFITATSLFDGHDASINIIRRMLQRAGAEVIHLGHNRSVNEILMAAVQEDAQGIAVSSYQGGHNEFFRYLVDELRRIGRPDVKVFGGGGGVIVPEEIRELEAYGVSRIYSPDDGRNLGLEGMAAEMVSLGAAVKFSAPTISSDLPRLLREDKEKFDTLFSGVLTLAEKASAGTISAEDEQLLNSLRSRRNPVPVVGFSGTGGAGKSSLIDEFVRRFLFQFPEKRLAVLSVDPSHRKSGGALLGDRLRMNAVFHERVFMRSLATRADHASLSTSIGTAIELCRAAGFDLIFVESAGMGQSDTSLVDHGDFSVFVMTSEYGAATQLEKIGMLDYADLVVLNKFDRERSEDALAAIRKQLRRNHNLFELADEQIPAVPAIASRFHDHNTNRAFERLIALLVRKLNLNWPDLKPEISRDLAAAVVPASRLRYLARIAETVRDYHRATEELAHQTASLSALHKSLQLLNGDSLPPLGEKLTPVKVGTESALLYEELRSRLPEEILRIFREYPAKREQLTRDELTYEVRGREIRVPLVSESLSGLKIPKTAVPDLHSWEDIVRFVRAENFPGEFPFTAGVFPLKRTGEDPTRMFAGEGNPERTNRRFHFISRGQKAVRLSTAFDSITLYGQNPDLRPDIYGKIGNAGVSICSVDDMKKLYSGFRLCADSTSVSMTINGPAPIILAFFLNAAINQEAEIWLKENGQLEKIEKALAEKFRKAGITRPVYHGDLPEGHDGSGLLFLGADASEFLPAETYAQIRKQTLAAIRGTVQADILKEDQAQNTCIFSTDFALKMMGDMQEFFVANDIANFYSVSISGYHIAEAGANPISQVAFTLANGFTYMEYYLSRGMKVDDFARNLSFFFSNGMDPEYAVIGRVARRIWSIALKNHYGAGERAQKLKYHIQTSGRSLHAQEISFNDIRTTLQALYAIMDNCNSLHTNAYDEAITTPTPESVRRAIAIQLIINRELGLTKNENPLQGSYFLSALTEMVEDAILAEFDRISERGGVLGAMETMYQRNKIQEESMYYEGLKQSGELPIIGVNTYTAAEESGAVTVELMRSSEEEKQLQLDALKEFRRVHEATAVAALGQLRSVALGGGNIFSELMETVKSCPLGDIADGLYEAGGQYRRNM